MKYIVALLCLSTLYVFAKPENEFWKHVYSKDRLVVIQDSTTVTGIIQNISAELDGDIHVRIKLDSQYTHMLIKNNYKHENKCLIVEFICMNPSPHKACDGYDNNMGLPIIGDYVEILGTYVLDKRHNITEIHPVYSWKVLRSILVDLK